jgi:hypothetical protein
MGLNRSLRFRIFRTGLIKTRRAILSRSLGGFQKPKGIYETASNFYHTFCFENIMSNAIVEAKL